MEGINNVDRERSHFNNYRFYNAYSLLMFSKGSDHIEEEYRSIDLEGIKINSADKKSKRIRSYINQVGDPYCLRYGNAVIEVAYADGGGSLQDNISAIFM